MRMGVVDSGATVPFVHVSTLLASTAHPPANAGALKLSRIVFGGSGSRTSTPVAMPMPLLPTTKSYVRPPRQSADGRNVGTGPLAGHECAHTGSGVSTFVIVRSTPGFTVVISVSVALWP